MTNDTSNTDKPKKSSKKRLLRLRAQMSRKRPKFRRENFDKFVRLKPGYRRAKGIDSRMRHKRNGQPVMVNKGYRGPKAVRGLHPSGFEIHYIANVSELETVNIEEEVAVIRATVGNRKRIAIIDRAKDLNIHLLNPMLRGRALDVDEAEYGDLDEEFDLVDDELDILDEEEFEFFDDDDFEFELDDLKEEE
ncbi:MAG: 50S ribosomal protein L32e [Candidatus Kariarchaeaceae archaeon]